MKNSIVFFVTIFIGSIFSLHAMEELGIPSRNIQIQLGDIDEVTAPEDMRHVILIRAKLKNGNELLCSYSKQDKKSECLLLVEADMGGMISVSSDLYDLLVKKWKTINLKSTKVKK